MVWGKSATPGQTGPGHHRRKINSYNVPTVDTVDSSNLEPAFIKPRKKIHIPRATIRWCMEQLPGDESSGYRLELRKRTSRQGLETEDKRDRERETLITGG